MLINTWSSLQESSPNETNNTNVRKQEGKEVSEQDITDQQDEMIIQICLECNTYTVVQIQGYIHHTIYSTRRWKVQNMFIVLVKWI